MLPRTLRLLMASALPLPGVCSLTKSTCTNEKTLPDLLKECVCARSAYHGRVCSAQSTLQAYSTPATFKGTFTRCVTSERLCKALLGI